MRFYAILGLALFAALPVVAEIQTSEVAYSDNGTDMKGYLAYDDAIEGERPGVLVVHEWWGHNAYARERAEKLAELGYTALAVDMYGDGKQAEHPQEAGKFSQAVMSNLDTAQARFEAALDVLKAHDTVDEDQIAAIGYCFGGGVVLHMARLGLPLDGVVSFHGSLGAKEKAEAGAVKAAILVCHGGADPFVPESQVEAFKEEMDAAGADYEVLVLEGAKHSFTNPDADELAEKFGMNGIGNDKASDDKSWAAMKDFFDEIFAE